MISLTQMRQPNGYGSVRNDIYTWDLAPDPKCKLNISSFLTLPHPLDCLICANDIMIIVSLHMMGDGKVGGWFNYVKVWVGGVTRGWYHSFSIFCFCGVVNCSVRAGT